MIFPLNLSALIDNYSQVAELSRKIFLFLPHCDIEKRGDSVGFVFPLPQ
jgi:hypothetical protein